MKKIIMTSTALLTLSLLGAVDSFAEAKKNTGSGENRIQSGNFVAVGNPVAGKKIPQGSLYQAKYQAWKPKGSKAVFYVVAGKNAGFSDDTAAVVIGGEGSLLFKARGPVKAGETYRISVKAKSSGTGRPDLCIYWDSKTKKGPFAYNLGIPKFKFIKQLSNGWMQAEGIIKVPAAGTGFTMILGAKGCKTDEDMVFFDDVEAYKFSGNAEAASSMKEENAKSTAPQNSESEFKKAKKSSPVKGNLVVHGDFNAAGTPVTEFAIDGGSLYKTKIQTYGKGKCFSVAGKNMGFSDDTAGVIMKNNAMFLFPVRGIKSGEKYKICVKAKPVGKASPKVFVYWMSPRKHPFDYALGVPAIPCGKKQENGWIHAEGVITVPAHATGFMIVAEARKVTGTDMVFFDDVEATLVK